MLQKLKGLAAVSMIIMLGACAHGKMGQIDQPLEKGTITKDTVVYIEPISAKNTQFAGDKSGDMKRLAEERNSIENMYNMKIAEKLAKLGYKTKWVKEPVKSGLVVTGEVTHFDHGSGAARWLVGFGAGSSNLYTDFKIEDRTAKKNLAKFQVIATSGGSGGMASYMDAHLSDGAEKLADYVNKTNEGKN